MRGTRVFLRPILSDSAYLRIYFYLKMGRRLDLDNPRTMNEKLQWLKLYNRHNDMTVIVDKIKVKDFIKEKINDPALHIVKTLAIWDKPEHIDLS